MSRTTFDEDSLDAEPDPPGEDDGAVATPPRGLAGRVWGRVFAAIYDPVLRPGEKRGNADRRAELLAHAEGDVLELGAGTGLNLDHYPRTLRSLTLTEPEQAMARRLRRRLGDRDARIVRAPAERLPVPNHTVDTVVTTLVLCTVPDVSAALAEARRVLRPTGTLLFWEHVRAASARLARWQDRLHRPWRALACGCNCNRDIEAAIRSGGFEITEISRGDQEAELPIVTPIIWGRARPVAA